MFICIPGLPSDILPTMRPELLSVDSASENNADTKDMEAEGEMVDVDTQLPSDDGVLVADEERRSGVVRLSVYWSYGTAVGRCLASIVLLSILLMQGTTFSLLIMYLAQVSLCNCFISLT